LILTDMQVLWFPVHIYNIFLFTMPTNGYEKVEWC